MSGATPESIDGFILGMPKNLYLDIQGMIETGERENEPMYFSSALMMINRYFRSEKAKLQEARQMNQSPHYGSNPLPGNDQVSLDLEEAVISKYEPIVLQVYQTVIQSMQTFEAIQRT